MSRKLIADLNMRSWRLCDQVQAHASETCVWSSNPGGANVLDFGVEHHGTLAGGISLALICMADLATIQLLPASEPELPFNRVFVSTDHPLLACMAAQYAGWPFTFDEYFAMCSGPARMARGEEPMLHEYGLTQSGGPVVGVFEAHSLPGEQEIKAFSEACGVAPEMVTLCVARTSSLPGAVQVVARSIEVAMHKLHELDFDLRLVKNATGVAPVPPIAPDDMKALGWTNDAILYGGSVAMWVDAEDDQIESLRTRWPSCSSRDFGRPFHDIFREYDYDFYKVDRLLFSPARIVVHSLESGKTFEFGQLRYDILRTSFGIAE